MFLATVVVCFNLLLTILFIGLRSPGIWFFLESFETPVDCCDLRRRLNKGWDWAKRGIRRKTRTILQRETVGSTEEHDNNRISYQRHITRSYDPISRSPEVSLEKQNTSYRTSTSTPRPAAHHLAPPTRYPFSFFQHSRIAIIAIYPSSSCSPSTPSLFLPSA
jgi:hypothetical protein